MSQQESMLVISAHAADFVWRAGGAVALAASRGDRVKVLCLTYGERGESASAWRAGQTLAEIKALRRGEAESAATALGAEIEFLDAGDYPLRESDELVDRIVRVYREVNPSVVLAHPLADPYNGDHPAAGQMALRARVLAQAIGYPAPGDPIGAPPVFLFEPHQPEMCGFKPEVLLDITPVFDAKRKAMECMGAQQHLWEYYTDLARRRGTQLKRNAGPNLGLPQSTVGRSLHAGVPAGHGQAELMRNVIVTGVARADLGVVDQLAALGVATVHEAIGRAGYLGPGLRPIQDGTRVGGTAVTALCWPGDNLMIHAAVEQCQAGDLLVVTAASPCTDGMFGELLATSLAARGVRGLVIEAGVRDVADLRAMGFPVWSAAVSAQGTVKETPGSVNLPISVGGQIVRPGDAIIADDDGVVCVPRAEAGQALAGARARVAHEEQNRRALADGQLGLDLYGLRDKLAARGVEYVTAGSEGTLGGTG